MLPYLSSESRQLSIFPPFFLSFSVCINFTLVPMRSGLFAYYTCSSGVLSTNFDPDQVQGSK